jgi:GH25 family lysozyme M1 (1,4-beta-N-acetylmuramidase)
MTAKRWRVLAVVGAIVGALAVVRVVLPANADTARDGGGGWAHAGAGPGAAPSGKAGGKNGARSAARMGAAAVPGGFSVAGIDVSSHDHSVYPIDWAGVAASGVKFAYVKATEGAFYTNNYFATDYQAARNAGLYAGAYVFARPDLGDPVGQADYFFDRSLWTADSQTLVPFVDVEWPYGALHLGPCYNLTASQLTTWLHAFIDRIEAKVGRPPMIYTNANWWNPCTGNDASFGGYPLDIAGYTATPPTLPAGWSTFAIWQYDAGNNQVAGNYDKDVFNGDLPGLATLAGPTPPAVVSLRSHANGRFATAENGGAAPVIANRGGIGTWEQFDEVDAGGGWTALRSHANGRYVTAENGGKGALIANRTAIGPWEKFKISHLWDGSVSLLANANNRYVTAEQGGASPLIANRTGVGTWEAFDAVPAPAVVAIKARANGQYVCADNYGNSPLIPNRSWASTWERYDMFDLGNGNVALRAHANGNFVTAQGGGAGPLVANRSAIGLWETFLRVDNADGSVSFKAGANGRYVTAENGGVSPLIANRTAIGGWEKFDIVR